ncbi:hypothetical protein TNCV_4293981 [Trichonephila clavipes]|uniref:Uncharacterized protein n=1 Tax=Trichonephila clavipes TaxID=2585209 RepID=A0A8X6V4M9_TRICX|nr:hypothetical protein TNCV_4293981 [Trichonephila clavipes]
MAPEPQVYDDIDLNKSVLAVALDYADEDSWREQPDKDGPIDSRLGLSRVSLLAKGERSTRSGAPRTTHVHQQLYDTSDCLASRCHHPEEKQGYAYRGGHGLQGHIHTPTVMSEPR